MIKRNKLLKEVGLKIRKLREEKGYSQEKFSFEVNLDRTYGCIKKW